MAKSKATAAPRHHKRSSYYTREALKAMRQNGDIRGHFCHAKKGRKSKLESITRYLKKTKAATADGHNGTKTTSTTPATSVTHSNDTNGASAATKAAVNKGNTIVRGKYTDWREPTNFR